MMSESLSHRSWRYYSTQLIRNDLRRIYRILHQDQEDTKDE